jgi:hypothetical protein
VTVMRGNHVATVVTMWLALPIVRQLPSDRPEIK